MINIRLIYNINIYQGSKEESNKQTQHKFIKKDAKTSEVQQGNLLDLDNTSNNTNSNLSNSIKGTGVIVRLIVIKAFKAL